MRKSNPESESTDRNQSVLRVVAALGGLGGVVTAVVTAAATMPLSRIAILVGLLILIVILGFTVLVLWQAFLVFRDTTLPKVCRALGEWLIERIRSLGSKSADDRPEVDEPADTS